MKSAYELAMERLGDKGATHLTDEQKAEIGNIDEKFRAKIAEREIFLRGLIAQAELQANYIEIRELKQQLAREVSKFREQSESEKDTVRNG